MRTSAAQAYPPPVPRIPHPRPPRIEACGLSHPGLQRASNEDAYAVAPAVGFFAVADGIGGNAAGEVASHLAVDVVLTMIEDAAARWPDALGASLLAESVKEANAWVRGAAAHDPEKAGMGTTLTTLLVLGEHAVVAHVGDSRAYLLSGRRLRRLTDDHTVVFACMQAGLMTAEEAATSEVRNMIVRAVGLDEVLDVDTRLVAVSQGDTFLLCSDGLHGVLGDDEIAAVLLAEPSLERAAERLVERANDAGGPDNVTVVLARVG